jgi:hypothetical protein
MDYGLRIIEDNGPFRDAFSINGNAHVVTGIVWFATEELEEMKIEDLNLQTFG